MTFISAMTALSEGKKVRWKKWITPDEHVMLVDGIPHFISENKFKHILILGESHIAGEWELHQETPKTKTVTFYECIERNADHMPYRLVWASDIQYEESPMWYTKTGKTREIEVPLNNPKDKS